MLINIVNNIFLYRENKLLKIKYCAIICIFFVCCNCAWHAIVGAFWSKEDAKIIDQWVLVAAGCIFVLIHIGFLIWLFIAYKEIREVKKKERKFSSQPNLNN